MGDLVGILNGKPVTKPLHAALARLKAGQDSRRRTVVGVANAGLGRVSAPTDDASGGEHHLISHDGVTLGCEGRITGMRLLGEHLRHYGLEIDIDEHTAEWGGEALARLIAALFHRGLAPADAVRRALSLVDGDYAITVLFADQPDILVAANHGHPLSIGQANLTACVATDPDAIAPLTPRLTALQPGEIAELHADRIRLFDSAGRTISYRLGEASPCPTTNGVSTAEASKADLAGFPNLTAKDLSEIPATIGRTLHALLPEAMPFAPPRIDRVLFLHEPPFRQATLLTAPWWRNFARVEATAVSLARAKSDAASLRQVDARTLIVGVMDGDGAAACAQNAAGDRLAAALAQIDPEGLGQLAMVSEAPARGECRIAGRDCMTWPHHGGPERGVAATKSVTGAMTTLAVMALKVGLGREVLSATRCHRLVEALLAAEAATAALPDQSEAIRSAASRLSNAWKQGDSARESMVCVAGAREEMALAEEGADKIVQIAGLPTLALEAGRLDSALRSGRLGAGPTLLIDMTSRKAEAAVSLTARLGGDAVVTLGPARPRDGGGASAHVPLPACPRESRPWVAVAALHALAYEIARAGGAPLGRPRCLATHNGGARLKGR